MRRAEAAVDPSPRRAPKSTCPAPPGVLQWPNGQAMTMARPTTASSETVPPYALVAVGAGVGGVGPVVAHHPQPALRAPSPRTPGSRAVLPGWMYGSSSGMPLTVTRPCVSQHLTVSPPTADDPLDQVLLVVGGQQADEGQALLDLLDDDGVLVLRRRLLVLEPAAGVLEDDDVPALRLGAEPGGELVDQDTVADLDRLLHGARRDHERLDEEGLQDQRYEDGDADEEGYLLDRGAPPAPLDLALELAPLRPAPAAGGRWRPAGRRWAAGCRRRCWTRRAACRGYPWRAARRRARARRRRDGPDGSSGRSARRSSRPGRSRRRRGPCRRRATQVVAGVAGVAAVVPQDEQGALGHDDVEGHRGRAVPGVQERDSSTDRPFTSILPLSQQTTWSPPTPTTRLM